MIELTDIRQQMVAGPTHRSGRAVSRLLGTTLLALALLVSDAPRASALNPTEKCYWLSGRVLDGLGQGVPGATVSVTPGCRGDTPVDPSRATTATDGWYRVRLLGTLASFSVTTTVNAPGYMVREDNVSGLGTSDEHAHDFLLQFDPGASLSPGALHSGGTVTLTARTPAPPPTGTGGGARVLADVQASGTLSMSAGDEDAQHFRTWTASHAVSPAAAEGPYAVATCIVRETYAGSCAAASAGELLSPVANSSFLVDDTAPTLAATAPNRFATLTSVAEVGTTYHDAISGLDPSSILMRVDGQPAPFSVAGSTIRLQNPNLTPGIHHVETQVADRAGNATRTEHVFTLASLTATPAALAFAEGPAVAVNPSGAIPGPSTVTFRGLAGDLSGFALTINAATSVGYGTVRRTLAPGSVDIEFTNSLGVKIVRTAPIAGFSSTHGVATLGPSGGELGAEIDASSVALPDVTAEIPPGFNSQGSTARVLAFERSAGPVIAGADPFGQQFATGTPVSVVGEVRGCFDSALLPSLPVGGQRVGFANSCFEYGGSQGVAKVRVVVGANTESRHAVLVGSTSPRDTGPHSTSPPCLDAAGGSAGCRFDGSPGTTWEWSGAAGVAFGCATAGAGPVLVDLCTGRAADSPAAPGPQQGFLSAWLNAFLYTDAAARHPLWQQNHVNMPAGGDRCPGDRPGLVRAELYRAASNAVGLRGTVATDSAGRPLFAGTYRDNSARWAPGQQIVRLGAMTGPTPQGPVSLPQGSIAANDYRQLSGVPWQLATDSLLVTTLADGQGSYELWWGDYLLPSQARGTAVAPAIAARSTADVWEAGSSTMSPAFEPGRVSGTVHLAAGTAFVEDTGYQLAPSVVFNAVVFFECG